MAGAERFRPREVAPRREQQLNFTGLRILSQRERIAAWAGKPGNFDQRRASWSEQFTTKLHGRISEDTAQFWKKMGSVLGVEEGKEFTTDHALKLYDRYFTGNKKEANFEALLTDLNTFYSGNPASSHDVAEIRWLSGIFGPDSGKRFVGVLTGEAELPTPEQVRSHTEAHHEESPRPSPVRNNEGGNTHSTSGGEGGRPTPIGDPAEGSDAEHSTDLHTSTPGDTTDDTQTTPQGPSPVSNHDNHGNGHVSGGDHGGEQGNGGGHGNEHEEHDAEHGGNNRRRELLKKAGLGALAGVGLFAAGLFGPAVASAVVNLPRSSSSYGGGVMMDGEILDTNRFVITPSGNVPNRVTIQTAPPIVDSPVNVAPGTRGQVLPTSENISLRIASQSQPETRAANSPTQPTVVEKKNAPQAEKTITSTKIDMSSVTNGKYYPVSQDFGYTKFSLSNCELYKKPCFHPGKDIAVPAGTLLSSPVEGKVMTAAYDRGLGNHVVVQLKDGRTMTFAHMSELTVKKNDIVRPGMMLGKSGATGVVTDAHLHVEYKNQQGEHLNPDTIFKWTSDKKSN